MNRDERRERDESGFLKTIHSIHGATTVFPIDLESNGSWFGVNDSGVVLGLLNRYQDPLKKNAVSRGKIIPKALSFGGIQKVSDFLGNLTVKNYNPFDVVLFSTENCYRYNWNGTDFNITLFNLEQNFFITSSSIDMDEVLTTRKQKFNDWTTKSKVKIRSANDILQEFHTKQTHNKSHSVLMAREKSHTKSICQAIISNSSNYLHYLPSAELEKLLQDVKFDLTKQTANLPFKSSQ